MTPPHDGWLLCGDPDCVVCELVPGNGETFAAMVARLTEKYRYLGDLPLSMAGHHREQVARERRAS